MDQIFIIFFINLLDGETEGPGISETRQIEQRAPLAAPKLSVRSSNDKIIIEWSKLNMKDTGGPIKSYNIRWRMMKRSRSKHKPEKWNISSQQVKIFKFPSRY